MLYVKEIKDVREIFYDKYSNWLNYIIYFIKYIFCVLTIKGEKCYIPYKCLKNSFIIKLIVIMLEKQNCTIVLSKQLLENIEFMNDIIGKKVAYVDGNVLFNYNVLNILKYIAKIKGKDIKQIEVSILVNNISNANINMIKYLSMSLKRLNIVTNQLDKFRRIEDELQEELGISILVTNSKRKSLLKAEIIINLDFAEDILALYQMNRNAIVIQKEKQSINKKSFNGINVVDYDIIFKKMEEDDFYNDFENKDVLLSYIDTSKMYVDIINKLDCYDVRVVNLIGHNGVINSKELL